jgi:hypothetical protein
MSEPETVQVSNAEEDRRTDRAILALLLCSPAGRPLSAEELVLELGAERLTILDAIDRLHRTGIVHRCDRFVFPTRTAAALDELLG